jgi:hypothetical protein
VQGPIKCALVVLAAAAILIVLVTPALDELPCTIGQHTRNRRVPVSATTILPFLTLPSPPAGYQYNAASQLSRVTDLLSSNCTLAC